MLGTRCPRLPEPPEHVDNVVSGAAEQLQAILSFTWRPVSKLHCQAQAHAHMLAEEAAGIAQTASAHALILTHFSPKITDPSGTEKAARRVFANARAARDGMIVTLEFP